MVRSNSILYSLRTFFVTLPIGFLLILFITGQTGLQLHQKLLTLGNNIWTDYITVRHGVVLPTCNPNISVDAVVYKLEQDYIREVEEDSLGLFEPEPFDKKSSIIAATKQIAQCKVEFSNVEKAQKKQTVWLKIFYSFEFLIENISQIFTANHTWILSTVFLLGVFVTSLKFEHIALKPIESATNLYVSKSFELIANSLLTLSIVSYINVIDALSNPRSFVYILLAVGFSCLACINILSIILCLKKKIPTISNSTFNIKEIGQSLVTIPLYAFMVIGGGVYFLYFEVNTAGLAIRFSQLLDRSDIFINVALYIWLGMLLRQTKLASFLFDALKPLKLKPEYLAICIIFLIALPTAYTGASGIIIIALGAVIYKELIRAGARKSLALATTAMSGSMGVVLSPCLLIVLIAALNKSVDTQSMFHWGSYIFVLSAVIFSIVVLLLKHTLFRNTDHESASSHHLRYRITASLIEAKHLVPYIVIFITIASLYFLLNVQIDQHYAPIVLPVIFLSMIGFEVFFKQKGERPKLKEEVIEKPTVAWLNKVKLATDASCEHIGALVMLMGGSYVLGGTIEQMDVVHYLLPDINSMLLTMLFLIVCLVGIGMVMDPFGAVVLVSVSIAPYAYNAGIDAIHFWMVALVAFELGYLSPPVALNHLLTRQVVGVSEVVSHENVSGWERYERYVLPIIVMLSTLLVVAYVPLFF